MKEINEMIISNYDCGYSYSVFVNGKRVEDEYFIFYDYDIVFKNALTFKDYYKIRRLIICEDGDIKIYE